MNRYEASPLPGDRYCSSVVIQICSIFATTVTIVNLIIAPLFVFTVLTQSKTIGRFKWFLLNHSFWCVSYDLLVTLSKPVVFFPSFSYAFVGPLFKNNGMTSSAVLLSLICCSTVCAVGGIGMSFIYRYTRIFPGRLNSIFASRASFIVYFLIHVLFIGVIGFFMLRFVCIDHAVMVANAVSFDPELASVGARFPSFIFMKKSYALPQVIACLVSLVAIGLILVVIPIIVMKTINGMNKGLHGTNQRRQSMLLRSIVAQMVITVFFQLLPWTVFFAFFTFELPYAAQVSTALMYLISVHATLEMLCVFYCVVPYRQFLVNTTLKLVKKTRVTSQISFTTPSKTVNVVPGVSVG